MRFQPLPEARIVKHEPIRLHPLGCDCDICVPAPRVDLRQAFACAAVASIPVYAILWAVWTITPN